MRTLQPRNGLVLVSIVPHKEHKTAAGIYIPGTNGMTFEFAKIIAVGPGILDVAKRCGMEDLKPGDTVLLKSGMAGAQLGQRFESMLSLQQEDGAKVSLVNQADILAIVVNDEPNLALTPAGERQLAVSPA